MSKPLGALCIISVLLSLTLPGCSGAPGRHAADGGPPPPPRPAVTEPAAGDGQPPGPDETVSSDEAALPRLLPVDLKPEDTFPVRYRSFVHELGEGRFVLSPDRRWRLRCVWVPWTKTTLPDWQFWLEDLTGEAPPRLLCSSQKTFEPGNEALTFHPYIIWAGNSDGVYAVSWGMSGDGPPSSVWHIDLEGNVRWQTHEAFALRGYIVGSVPGSDLIVTQAVAPETGGDSMTWRYDRLVVCDPAGEPVAAFVDPEHKQGYFQAAGPGGRILYSSGRADWAPFRLHLGTIETGASQLVGEGWLAEFRPGYGTVTFFGPAGDDYCLLECDPATGDTRRLALLSGVVRLRGGEQCEWSADGAELHVLAEERSSMQWTVYHIRFDE